MLQNCPNLTIVNFYGCFLIEGEKTSNELSPALLSHQSAVRTFAECQSALSYGIFLTSLSCFEGTLPGIIVKLISEGKAVLYGCTGPFYLPSDLTSIKDIEKIDLSSLDARLQGANEI